MSKKRCVIYPKDVQIITGRSERYGHSLLGKIKVVNGKEPYQFVTLHEFAEFSGIPISQIESYIY